MHQAAPYSSTHLNRDLKIFRYEAAREGRPYEPKNFRDKAGRRGVRRRARCTLTSFEESNVSIWSFGAK